MKELEFKLDIATKLARKGRVSRRDFVQLAIAAGFTAAIADTMFTAAAPFYADDNPRGIVVADFDGRCGTDLAIMNGSLSNELWLYRDLPPTPQP